MLAFVAASVNVNRTAGFISLAVKRTPKTGQADFGGGFFGFSRLVIYQKSVKSLSSSGSSFLALLCSSASVSEAVSLGWLVLVKTACFWSAA